VQSCNSFTGAASALGLIGPGAQKAVAGLVGTLQDPLPEVQHEAAHALGSIGPDARDAIPALQASLRDPDRQVGDAVARRGIK
jgi:HEAT repeat protein